MNHDANAVQINTQDEYDNLQPPPDWCASDDQKNDDSRCQKCDRKLADSCKPLTKDTDGNSRVYGGEIKHAGLFCCDCAAKLYPGELFVNEEDAARQLSLQQNGGAL